MRIHQHLFISAFTLSVFLSCTTETPVELPQQYANLENIITYPLEVEPAAEVELYPELSFGDTDELFIGRIVGAVVDDRGRVFIADGDKRTIHVYTPEGEHVRQIGGEGEGPGEFGNISNLSVDSEYLYANDWNQRRVNVFSLENLQFSHTIPLMREDMDEEELSGHSPGQYLLRSDGNLLVSYTQPYRSGNLDEERNVKYYVIDREGKVISGKIFEHRTAETLHDQIDGGFMVMASPFGRRPLIAMDRNDRIIWAWSEDFLVQVFDGEGNYERAFFYPYRKSSLDRNAVIDRYEQDRTRRMVRSADVPATWPALNSLTVDDESRLWVSTITDDEETYDWWVLDEYGVLLAAFTWPRERTIQAVKNGYLYARQTDEFDLVEIMRYQVWLGEADVES